jgi:quercetin dioxygenase-like cupin family protein
MQARIARFAGLPAVPNAYLDNGLPGHSRDTLNIIGTSVGRNDPDAKHPLGSAELTLGMQRAEPGNGPGLHSHEAIEVFVILAGRWRAYWIDQDGEGEAELEPFDVISVPAGVWRGLEVIGDETGVICAARDRADGGGLTWHPSIIESAERAGRSLIDGRVVTAP